jgi:multidrug efflux pump subunit AcrB
LPRASARDSHLPFAVYRISCTGRESSSKAYFTATWMIGLIALTGIIVRNSILLVDFTAEEVRDAEADSS